MIGIRTAFLLSLSVVTAPLYQRHVGANADVAPDAFAADTFDYIVVGGGTAGLAVGARLAKGTPFKVGVIEAGAYYPDEPRINIPGMPAVAGDPQFDWMLMTTPQAGLANAVHLVPRGKVLGGTSTMNGMYFNRPSTTEYDGWEALGNPGWNWQTLLDISKKSEAATPAPKSTPPEYLYTFNPLFHGSTGPVKVSFPKFLSTILPVVFKTMRALGIQPDHDASDGTNVGEMSVLTSVNFQNSSRSYSAPAYYVPCGCNNLVVLTNAQVTKINFASKANPGGDFTATGVTYSSSNKTYTVSVAKEVIVSGGTYLTPQILELSGIGDKGIVSKAGVNSIIDLPGVGENLQDHACLVLKPTELVSGYISSDVLSDPVLAAKYLEEYNVNKTGPYSSAWGSVAYLPLSSFVDQATRVSMLKDLDAELAAATLTPAEKATYPTLRNWLDQEDVAALEVLIFPLFLTFDPTVVRKNDTSYVSFGVCPQHPFSRGSVHINSSDGLAPPSIDPQYLSSTFDRKMTVEAAKYFIKFTTQEPFKSAIAVNPYDDSWTDSFVNTYVTNFTTSEHHPVGTAALLPRSDGGVVSPKLIVYGTTNVRVADASVMPMHIASHTQATIYAIAEIVAKLILADA